MTQWSILVGAVVAYFIGALWYSPLLFAQRWAKLAGINKKEMEEIAKKGGMWKRFLAAFIGNLLLAYVLLKVVMMTNTVTVLGALSLGFWLWLGLIGVTTFGIVLWENKSISLWVLNNTYSLVIILVTLGIHTMML